MVNNTILFSIGKDSFEITCLGKSTKIERLKIEHYRMVSKYQLRLISEWKLKCRKVIENE